MLQWYLSLFYQIVCCQGVHDELRGFLMKYLWMLCYIYTWLIQMPHIPYLRFRSTNESYQLFKTCHINIDINMHGYLWSYLIDIFSFDIWMILNNESSNACFVLWLVAGILIDPPGYLFSELHCAYLILRWSHVNFNSFFPKIFRP